MFNHKNYGVTLIECLIATILILLIVSVLFSILLTAQKNNTLQNDLSYILQNARIARTILTNDIHQAGFTGCAKATAGFPFINHTSLAIDSKNSLQITDQSFSVWYASGRESLLLNKMINSETLELPVKADIAQKDLLIITDCKSAEIITIAAIKKSRAVQTVITTQPLKHLYEKNTRIYRFQWNHYFLLGTHLYLQNEKNQKEALLDDVAEMKIQKIDGVLISLTLLAQHNKLLRKKWYFYA